MKPTPRAARGTKLPPSTPSPASTPGRRKPANNPPIGRKDASFARHPLRHARPLPATAHVAHALSHGPHAILTHKRERETKRNALTRAGTLRPVSAVSPAGSPTSIRTRTTGPSHDLPVSRSLIALGPSLALTIPSEWVAALKLGRKSKVILEPDGDGFRVKPAP